MKLCIRVDNGTPRWFYRLGNGRVMKMKNDKDFFMTLAAPHEQKYQVYNVEHSRLYEAFNFCSMEEREVVLKAFETLTSYAVDHPDTRNVHGEKLDICNWAFDRLVEYVTGEEVTLDEQC